MNGEVIGAAAGNIWCYYDPEILGSGYIRAQYLLNVDLLKDQIPSSEQFPFNLTAVRHLKSLKIHPKVTFLVGENGSGKSTLLEAIAVAWGFNAEGGSQNFRFATQSSHSDLYKYLKLIRSSRKAKDGFFLRAESFFNVATTVDQLGLNLDGYGGKSLHAQSHGESILALLMTRFRGNGFYILDEPEAALSPARQMALISRIHDLVKQNSQFLIATHSPIIMAYPHSSIFMLGESGIRRMEYTQTEHYQVTKQFLSNHIKMLKVLMDA